MKPSTSLTIFVIFFGLLSLSIVSVDANTYPIVPKDPILCTMQYAPVCGYTPVQCVSAPCEPIRQTYGNSCMASVAGAIEITQGTCDDTIPTTPAPVGVVSVPLPPLVIGGVKDIQECIGAAGYTWEGRLGKCVRPWLEKAVVVNILSQMTPCVANSQTLCLQIQRRNGIEVFSGTIAGWSYTPGYAYRLLLQSQIDENAGSAMTPSYTLIKVLSMRGQNPIGLVGTDWSIASLNGNVITSPGTISFTRSTISGRLCNNFSGIYSANWNTITAPTMISTEMYCTTDAMSVEDALHLNGATYVLSENTLTLRTLAGDTIVWKKKVY